MLSGLPLELLIAIFSQLTNKNDLKNVCQVSKRLSSIATPILYRSITVNADDMLLHLIDVAGFLHGHDQSMNLLHYAKEICVSSPFHRRRRKRCLHNNDDVFYEDLEDGIADDGLDDTERHCWKMWTQDDNTEIEDFRRLRNTMLSLLLRCKPDGLRTFAWKIGTCVPDQILGSNGYLPLKQRELESIHLITDGNCSQHTLDLREFKKLKALSWTGLRSDDDLLALHHCFKEVSHQLVYLNLDFLQWEKVPGGLYGKPNFIAWSILECSPNSTTYVFPALKHLSLSAFSFEPMPEKLASSFDWSSLQSLRLRFCIGWEDFLDNILLSRQQLRLESLEIQSNIEYDDGWNETRTISNFIGTFEGLKELFIAISGPTSHEILQSILRHELTLRNFVYHQRSVDLDVTSPNFERPCDIPDLSFLPKDIKEFRDNRSRNPFNSLDLECLGLCGDPKILKEIISPLAEKQSLKVLHVRQSGSDLRHFQSFGVARSFQWNIFNSLDAESSGDDWSSDGTSSEEKFPEITKSLDEFSQWAFGPQGFRSLEILVFGDLSLNGRYAKCNVYLCRNIETPTGRNGESSKNYRHMTKKDRTLHELLQKYSHVLSACPTDLII